MYILEVLIYIISIALIWSVFRKKTIQPRFVIIMIGTNVLLLILHVILFHFRWQIYSLYSAVFLVCCLGLLHIFSSVIINKSLKIFLGITFGLLVFISSVTSYVFPTYELPLPSGEYLIGTESFVIEDENRIELYGNDETEFRKIKIQLWYPAETIDGYEQAPWLEDGVEVARALSKDMGLPSFVLDQTVDIMSNSYQNAPISSSLNEYPVVIISHGWRGFRNLNTDFAEELASLGYIVIGIDHSYGSVATVFEDDDIAYLNLDALPLRETTPNFIEYANQLVNTYAGDITTTIDYLETINALSSSSRFSGRLDLSKIGLLGHSTGGGADVAIALNDDRIDSVIGLDAWVEPIDEFEIDKGLLVPSLFIRSGAWETGFNNDSLYSLIGNSAYPPELYQIDGTTHYDFAMVYMYSPLTKLIGFSGEVESEYLTNILKTMIADFFNETLRNNTTSEINPEIWDEVRVIEID